MEHLRFDDRLALLNVMALILKAMAHVSTGSHMDEHERISIAVFYQSLIGQSPQTMINCMAINSLALMLKIRRPQSFLQHDRVEQVQKIIEKNKFDLIKIRITENNSVIIINYFGLLSLGL